MSGDSDILLELGWTALSIISMSLVFIYSISVVGDARPTVSSPARPNYLAISRQQKAKILAEKQLEQRRRAIRENWSFRLKRLPPELQLLILSYSADWPETYRALVLVSRHIYNLTLHACLPIMPITLSSTKQLTSFASLVHKRRSSRCEFDRANLVHRLWIFSRRKENFTHTYRILRACVNIRVLACDARTLVLMMHSPRFKHTMCRNLTLLESHPQWVNALDTPSGLQFLRQLTHLRVTGEQNVPKTLSFDRLLYLSYWEKSFPDSDMIGSEVKRPSALDDKSIFPSLQQVVLTRRCDTEERAPLLCDQMLVLLCVRRDCTEMEIWRNDSKGKSLWKQAAQALSASNKLTL